MGSIKIVVKDDKKNDTAKWIDSVKSKNYVSILEKYGKQGVKELTMATPKDTGKTADSWSYSIEKIERGRYRLIFSNSNVSKEYANVAILLQYGHSSRNGTWVEGRDYINPALKPILDSLTKELYKEI